MALPVPGLLNSGRAEEKQLKPVYNYTPLTASKARFRVGNRRKPMHEILSCTASTRRQTLHGAATLKAAH